jgi:hypothetical protein
MKKIAQNSATQTKMFGHFSAVFHLPAAINSAEHLSLSLSLSLCTLPNKQFKITILF